MEIIAAGVDPTGRQQHLGQVTYAAEDAVNECFVWEAYRKKKELS
jgi:hypothetical protein